MVHLSIQTFRDFFIIIDHSYGKRKFFRDFFHSLNLARANDPRFHSLYKGIPMLKNNS